MSHGTKPTFFSDCYASHARNLIIFLLAVSCSVHGFLEMGELEGNMTLGKISMMIRFWAGIQKGSIFVIGNIFFFSS
jgi:hypothetical protein